MKTLFIANNHSQFKISYHSPTIDFPLREIAKQFGIYDFSDCWQPNEAERRSQNFLLFDASLKPLVLIRRNGADRTLDDITLELELLRWCKSREVPVPVPINNCIFDNDRIFTAYHILEGEHYSGKDNQLETAGKELARLYAALEAFPDQHRLKKRKILVSQSYDLAQLFSWIESDDLLQSLLQSKRFLIEQSFDITRILRIETEPMEVIHGDLHPHNFFFNGSWLLAILDFSEISYGSRIEDVAFAAHRLIRQRCVYEGTTDPDMVHRYIADFYARGFEKESLLKPLIVHTALKKIYTVMKLYMNGQKEFIDDLDKFINFLSEADYFG